jgi:hypothetical protein
MVYAAPKNEMVGVWKLVSAIADPDGKKITMFGEHGSGLLIFTSDLHYVTVLHNPNAPKFQSNSRMAGTPEENKAAVQSIKTVTLTVAILMDPHTLIGTTPMKPPEL